MSKRLSPAQRLEEEIDAVFAGGEDLAGAIEEVARLGARLLCRPGSKPAFVGLDAAASESGDAWEGSLTGLGERGLVCPLLVISDGAPGFG